MRSKRLMYLSKVMTLAELPGETDNVEEFAGIYVDEVVTRAVELVVAFAFLAEVIQEETAPASTLAARAVTRPQALVAHPRALMTIEFDIEGWRCGVISKINEQVNEQVHQEINVK